MSGFKYALFDLDGTLTDSAPGIINSATHSLRKLGIPVPERSELFKFIGPPIRDSFRQFYGLSDERTEEAVGYFYEYMMDKGLFENQVYPGIAEMLEVLRSNGISLIIATSKPEITTNIILKHFGLTRFFDFIAGATVDGKRSDKYDVIEYAIKNGNVKDRASAVMIGDRKHDMIGAVQAKIKSIGVLYGYGDHEELTGNGATFIAAKPEDVTEIILG